VPTLRPQDRNKIAAAHAYRTSDMVSYISMRLVTFCVDGKPEGGVLAGDQVTGFGKDMLSVIASGNLAPTGSVHHLKGVKMLAPVPRPPKLICIGLNYLDHAKETGQQVPDVPTVFNKFTNVVIGPGESIVLPKASKAPDYEAEMAIVIGPGGRNIPASKAMDHVFGYTIVNDVSARDIQNATSQWLLGKTCDTFAPMGPWIVTADEIVDPHALDIWLEIDGHRLQNSNTRELIFKIPRLIEYISSVVTLEPGDVIATGTPGGIGFKRNPQRLLKPGDEVVIHVDGIGELRNPVVAET
jgi:2-keto-4-pentenoate hydratase/2-oxohepta-3-ene-1,7-dioic acid hydratase in catechol pathway